ncbi:type I polyketide synthase [Streptomyces sp. NPDC003691]
MNGSTARDPRSPATPETGPGPVSGNRPGDGAGPEPPAESVAVIGMAGRFPMARTVEEFWRNLREGRECLETLDDTELRRQGVPDSVLSDPGYMRRAGTLHGIEEFDADFFGFPPSLAATMDPQLRLLLETSWHALEDAGCDPERNGGAVGVFVSGSACGYYPYHVLSRQDLRTLLGAGSSSAQMSLWSANDVNFYATRIAHAFDLRGPALSVQTACSSALTAVHLACQSLLCGESDTALAGGMSVKVPHRVGYLRDLDSVMSPDGHCRPFDAKSGGTVFTSGGGVVVLKRLSDALADGDHVRAVIRGSAVNNDGSLKMGYTAPSVDMQAAVVREALAVAGVGPRDVEYVEAHGTGTALGDPVEVAALRRAYGERPDEPWCGIGSVKGNVGHCETAAGVVGLIKAVLCLENRTLVPTLHFTEANPELQLAQSPFFIQSGLREWSGEHPRFAGVTSLGAGGTNVHVVLEEPPGRPAAVPDRTAALTPEHALAPVPASTPKPLLTPAREPRLLLLSARSEQALAEAGGRLAVRLRETPGPALGDAALTLAEGRRAFRYRTAFVARDREEAAAALGAPGRPAVDSDPAGPDPSVLLLFPGAADGSGHTVPGLYESEPAFAEAYDHGAALFAGHLGAAPGDRPARALAALEGPTAVTARAFCAQYAAARALEGRGVRPAAVAGQGAGEFAAAVVAGVMSLADAVGLVVRRGTPDEAPAPLLAPPELPFFSGTTGGPLGAADAVDPAWWATAGRDTDPGESALAAALADGSRLLVSAGADTGTSTGTPRPALPLLPAPARGPSHRDTPVRDAPGRAAPAPFAPGAAGLAVFLGVLGELWTRGVAIDCSPTRRPGDRRTPLPGYPFQRSRHWLESTYAATANAEPAPQTATPAPAHRTTEELLAALWCEVLGVESVQPDDDFFLLGGDSVMAARITGRARSAGLRFSPRTMFRNPTLHALAEAVGPGPAATGPVPATAVTTTAPRPPADAGIPPVPAQLELTADPAVLPELDVPLLFEAADDLDPGLLREALAHAVRHHEALHTGLADHSGLWEHRPTETDPAALAVLPWTGDGPPGPAALVEAAAAEARRLRPPGARPAVAAVLVDAAPEHGRHLVVLAHAGAVDRTALRLLAEDLTTACRRLRAGREVLLPPVPTPWRTWADCLTTWALDDAVLLERPYWLERIRRAGPGPSLTPGAAPAPGARGPVRRLSATLGPELTGPLRTVQRRHRAGPGVVVLTAVAEALARETGGEPFLVDLLGSARDGTFPGIDLGRTVGRCTAAHPLLLGARHDDPARLLDATREALDDVPHHGVHYGILRHLHPPTAEALRQLPTAGVTFADHGVYRPATAAATAPRTPLHPVPLPGPPPGEPPLARGHALDVRTYRASGRTRIDWWYDGARCTEETVRGLRERTLVTLGRLAEQG